jgi:excisionase family DNA binding protein
MASKNKPKSRQATIAQAMQALMERPAVTVEDAAVLLNLSRHGAYAAVEKGEIASFRVGNCIRIPSVVLREMLHIDHLDGTEAGAASPTLGPRFNSTLSE